MKQKKSDGAVATEILVKLSPEQIRFVAVPPDPVSSTKETGSPKAATWNLVLSLALGLVIGAIVYCTVTRPHVTNPDQYLANLAAGAVLYAALAMVMRGLHTAYKDMRFDVSAGMLTAMAALWVAIVGLSEISALGTSLIGSSS